jgi:hypothetical protein
MALFRVVAKGVVALLFYFSAEIKAFYWCHHCFDVKIDRIKFDVFNENCEAFFFRNSAIEVLKLR